MDRRDAPNSLRRVVSCASGHVRQVCSTWHGKVSDVGVRAAGGREAQMGLHSPPCLTIIASATSPLRLVLGRGALVTARATCDLPRRDIDDWEAMTCCAGTRRRSMLLWVLVGGVLICVVLLDAFETIVLPRRVARRLRLARLVIRVTWQLWSSPARGHWRSGERREIYLSFYGPFALLVLIGVWAAGLISGFALLMWGLGAQMVSIGGDAGFGTTLYGTGTTFLTLGLGDVLPHTALGRMLVVLEAGIGFT